MPAIPEGESRRVVVVVDDLFFAAKIGETARHVGAEPVFVNEAAALFEQIRRHHPLLIIVDLGFMKADAVALIEQLKHEPETRHITVIGYCAHVNRDLMERASDAGCDQVLPQSAFSRRLPELLRIS